MKSIKTKTLFFADASLTISPPYSKALFKEMKELNKYAECFGNVNVLARDDELLKLASDAGIINWYVGIESISQENINQIGKSSNKIENYAQAIKNIYEYGMLPAGSIIFGYDSDTLESFDVTLKAVYDWKLNDVTFCILNPIPGTRLYNRLEKENRITNYDWTLFSEKNVNFKPKNMSGEELFENIEIAPAFRIPKGNEDGPLHYEEDYKIYSRDEFYPSNIVIMSEQTQIRGVDVVQVGITPFQYNPVTKQLKVYRDIRVNVTFTGGNGQFGENRLRSRLRPCTT